MSQKVVTIIECDRQGCRAQEEILSDRRFLIGGYRLMNYPDNWRNISNNGNTSHVCPSCAKKFEEITNKFMVEKKT
jgi:hypothetical protein